MISIYNGRRRSLGNEETKDVHLQISVKMRKHLHHFKGARLGVFIAIALHVDEKGWSWPPVNLIKKESAYQSDDTVYRALADLCGGTIKGVTVKPLTIKGHRVLLRTKTAPPHAPAGLQNGKRNFYLFFPTLEEVKTYAEEEDSVLKQASDFYDPKNQYPKNYDPTFQDTENQGAEEEPGFSQEEPGRKEEPHTHEAEPPLFAAAQSATAAEQPAVGGCSKFTLTQILEWVEHRAAQPGSGINDPVAVAMKRRQDGLADELIAAYFARTPEQLVVERAAPLDTRLFYPEACQIVVALTQTHGSNPAQVIAELDVSEEVRARLRAKFVAEESTADVYS